MRRGRNAENHICHQAVAFNSCSSMYVTGRGHDLSCLHYNRADLHLHAHIGQDQVCSPRMANADSSSISCKNYLSRIPISSISAKISHLAAAASADALATPRNPPVMNRR